ncbi:MAG TPA: methylated-DNA--[protein]-cysteine S-methyltransferase [Candidatus Aquicultor sp.]|jgi:O-6-methylguanine DNA methyltransferase
MWFNTYATEWGTGAIIMSDNGLAGLIFPQQSEEALEQEIERKFGACAYDETIGDDLISTIGRYLSGEPVQFAYQVDYGNATEFERTVYNNLKAIPYGKMTTYAGLASLCGRPKAARAVGNAMAKNPVPIVVPCHRVLKSDGSVGGWSGKRGWKERLLSLEGIGVE